MTLKDINFLPTGISVESGMIALSGEHQSESSAAAAAQMALDLLPWRKGPFRLGDLVIDAEWRSDKKWDRLNPAALNLQNKIVADVGCNNGYYLFRIALAGAQNVTGFDPTHKYKTQFDFVAAHAPRLPIDFRLEGWQALSNFPDHFDTIFLMGINYHEPHPPDIYHACRSALKKDGLLVCESVVAAYPENLTIYPPGKYFGIGGVYGVPTPAAIAADLEQCGFGSVSIQHIHLMSPDEQRATQFSPQRSFQDFRNADGTSTEGYPLLHRAALTAKKT